MRSRPYPLVILVVLALLLPSVRATAAQEAPHLYLFDAVATPNPGAPSYQVTLYFSLLDSGGNPIKNLSPDDLTLEEDGHPVAVDSLKVVEEPVSVVVLLDTSGSMAGKKMEAARKAAVQFIQNLREDDRVAVLTFDAHPALQIDFTEDHKAASQNVELIRATPGGGTCLYDALFQAVQMVSTEPMGRRAILLLTDGVDEINGTPCSTHSLEDVLTLATNPAKRVPIYPIGLGKYVSEEVLDRLAKETHARAQYAPGPDQLAALFGRMNDELRSRYRLSYTSRAHSGSHTLALKVRYRDIQEQAQIKVDFPPLPYFVLFEYPKDGEKVYQPLTIAITVGGEGVPIKKVQFLANGAPIGEDSTPPYTLKWDPTQYSPGTDILLEVVLRDANGTQLARSGITVHRVPPPTPTPTPLPVGGTSTPTAASTGIQAWWATLKTASWRPLVLGGVGLLGMALLVFLLLGVRRRKIREAERARQWEAKLQAASQAASTDMEHTRDVLVPSSEALGVLVVLQSEDPALLNRRFEITRSVTTLGRKSTNDIVFPRDMAVSRQHAVIEERDGHLYLSEIVGVDERGHPRRPTYGTFLNGRRIEGSVLLHDGDEIQLGKRLRLRFEAVRPMKGGEDRTIDQGLGDEDRTIDFG